VNLEARIRDARKARLGQRRGEGRDGRGGKDGEGDLDFDVFSSWLGDVVSISAPDSVEPNGTSSWSDVGVGMQLSMLIMAAKAASSSSSSAMGRSSALMMRLMGSVSTGEWLPDFSCLASSGTFDRIASR
jgi:hypothetical protein